MAREGAQEEAHCLGHSLEGDYILLREALSFISSICCSDTCSLYPKYREDDNNVEKEAFFYFFHFFTLQSSFGSMGNVCIAAWES